MAQWSHAERTLFTKVVYYGPAFGGKTTNLESLHRLTDPRGTHRLISVKTADDRTLFFDLLPFDLGEILGYQVGVKLYTVPGQVRYDTTRQMVLAGADAVVFVADSCRHREEQNRWSLQDLVMNMRAKGLDPHAVPLVFQFNKQDLPEAASPEEIRGWLRLRDGVGLPSVATEGTGVLETFIAATRAMLERIVGLADERTRGEIDLQALQGHLDRAFAPHLARQAEGSSRSGTPRHTPIVLGNDDLLESSIQAGISLGEALTGESAQRSRAEREVLALRGLSDALRRVGASFDRSEIIDSGLAAAAAILDAPRISLISHNGSGQPKLERAHGKGADPLCGSDAGRRLLARMLASGRPCVVDDLQAELAADGTDDRLRAIRAVAAAPVEPATGCALLAYAPTPDGRFGEDDVRFLATLAAHLAVGLEKARLYEELSRRGADGAATKPRRNGRLTEEMGASLDAVVRATIGLRDRKCRARERTKKLETIFDSAERLQELLAELLSGQRTAELVADERPPSTPVGASK